MRELEPPNTRGDAAPGPEPAMPFVREVLGRLSEGRVRYCVLRNYRCLPHGLGGTDLDLLVRAEDLETAFRMMCQAAPRHGGVCISGYRAEALITSFCGRSSGVWWGVKIDVFPGLTHRGVPFYDASDLLERAPSWHGIPVAPEGEASIIALLKELLTNSASRKDYDQLAAAEYAKNPVFYEKRLGDIFGSGAVAAFRQYLARPGSPALMRTAAHRMRWALCWRAFRQQPLRVLATKIVGLGRRLRRLFRPPGIMLAVLGTDDTGRRSLIARIQPVLGAAVHGHVHPRHLRPGLLPDRGPCPGGLNAEAPVADPQPRGRLGGWKSLFRLVYYTLDYSLGYWITIYPTLVKRPCAWIFDGDFHDFLVAPLDMGAALPQRVGSALAFALPKPDVVICLGARIEASRWRKPNLAARDFNRQASSARGLCREDCRMVWIDTEGTPEEWADRVLSAVVARVSARYRTGRLPCTKPDQSSDAEPT
jgi:hypothetical protein